MVFDKFQIASFLVIFTISNGKYIRKRRISILIVTEKKIPSNYYCIYQVYKSNFNPVMFEKIYYEVSTYK